ncbi:hypothetical protein BV22DRAFT_1026390 [Leucogyrophana mollusca]|uniref:Uncharacterized protein n=1 Tax=Leucogyrophana mollusca TaxID=85980 RepID=A0ACB8AVY1_9AGAM|nr:hypothetical protein BV22DRAFT_1026390 [Leucogyrophana mollusca]
MVAGPPPVKLCTPEVLRCIRSVIRETHTPSWLRTVPSEFGSPRAGTLKADEWRTMTTVYLPLALVSMWGEGTSHRSSSTASRLRCILDHTMALVSAVRLACSRSTTMTRAEAYRSYMATWVRQLQELHPDIKHRPNGHMSLHIYNFLVLFGPVRSWWCFPFERLIGQLQRLPSNHKFGKLIRCASYLLPLMLN